MKYEQFKELVNGEDIELFEMGVDHLGQAIDLICEFTEIERETVEKFQDLILIDPTGDWFDDQEIYKVTIR